ncbi:hypothetical protein QUF80_04515 [Desulfococcaceae bacterium HSG8]|nr:hypothetical protein [Desulfococcaceae bacterium HSG8]
MVGYASLHPPYISTLSIKYPIPENIGWVERQRNPPLPADDDICRRVMRWWVTLRSTHPTFLAECIPRRSLGTSKKA